MRVKKVYLFLIQFLIIILLISLLFTKSTAIFAVIFALSAAILIIHILVSKNSWKVKIMFISIYTLILILQEVFIASTFFNNSSIWLAFLVKNIIGIIIIFVPFFVRYLHYIYTLEHQFSMISKTSISFDMIREINNKRNSLKKNVSKSKTALSKENIHEIANDIPRHSYIKYLNRNALSESYFAECEKSLNDENLYIVLSSTGSSASELISLFTQKNYNHVSLSLDKELKTTISYNGGENLTLPGLSQEQLESFNKKSDASIMVYKIKATKEQKKRIIEKINEINNAGSAYNLVGLVTKASIRPNIMFCSQFVYSILKIANLEYFEANNTKVKPTDFVENDYYRKLEFCYEIAF
ncbi:hypothetical protein M4K87_03950 [Staphylococcus equorum]|uniref:hypothetical protein n=1 Tax=Staphylococcus equorum TaxID=246432 RepID=UPI002408197D|nr:hypothetical protein [Staphylococcus equorum]MDG0824598.1 hypothetical protein [Staphylococcus equorum]